MTSSFDVLWRLPTFPVTKLIPIPSGTKDLHYWCSWDFMSAT